MAVLNGIICNTDVWNVTIIMNEYQNYTKQWHIWKCDFQFHYLVINIEQYEILFYTNIISNVKYNRRIILKKPSLNLNHKSRTDLAKTTWLVTAVYSRRARRDSWLQGFQTLSIVRFPSSGERWETFTLLGLLEKPNLRAVIAVSSSGTNRVYLSEILGFRTLSIVQVLKDITKEEHDVSETGSVSVLTWGKIPTLWGPLERASLNHWTSLDPISLKVIHYRQNPIVTTEYTRVSPTPPTEDGNRSSFQNAVSFKI
jgi:hypothetical protein